MEEPRQTAASISVGVKPSQPFELGGCLVDPASGRIVCGGEGVQVEPKAMETLLYLVRRPGQVVSRQELEAAVWGGRVVSYDAVTNAVIKLRRAFRDSARAPRVIETLSKRGYRLVAEINMPPAEVSGPAPQPVPSRPRSPRTRFAALIALALALVATLWWAWDGERPARSPTQWEGVAGAGQASIVVLPFANLTGEPNHEYFSNGITTDLITDLAQIPELFVIARESAFDYGPEDNLQSIGRELGVRYVLKGSVSRERDRVRINAQLIDAFDGRHLWGERFEGTLADTFALQDAITDRISTLLRVELAAPAPGGPRKYTAGMEAYDHFLRGKDHYGRLTLEELDLAADSFARAIALDPQFARAYASLGLVYLRRAIEGWEDDPQAMLERAQSLAGQALALDAALPEVHFVNAFVALFGRRHQHAVEELDRAITLRPSYADAHALLGWVLHFAGRPAEARASLDRAMKLNPRIPAAYLLILAEMEFGLHRYKEAVAALERAAEMNPVHPRTVMWLAAAYARTDRLEDARWAIEELLVLHPTVSVSRLREAFPFKDPEQLERLLHALRNAGLPD
jgi:adenylate cyclase